MTKPETPEFHWLSTCHDAEIVVVGGAEGTNHAKCCVCKEPCNIYDKNQADAYKPIMGEVMEEIVKAKATPLRAEIEQIAGLFTDRLSAVPLADAIEALISKRVKEARVEELKTLRNFLTPDMQHEWDTCKYLDMQIEALEKGNN